MMTRFGRAFAVIAVLLLGTNEALAEKLIALTIGVQNYAPPWKKLPGPVKDAAGMAEVLKDFGFQVYRLLDPDVATLQRGIRQFFEEARNADAVLFYFNGHGSQINGENYISATDGQFKTEDDFRRDFWSVNSILERLDANAARFKLFILDACRSNPYIDGGRQQIPYFLSTGGYAEMHKLATNSLVAFASAPGQYSYDTSASTGYGLYTGALLDVLRPVDKIELRDLMAKARDEAVRTAERFHIEQVPWESSSMRYRYFLVRQDGGRIVDLKPELPVYPASREFVVADSDRRLLQRSDLASLTGAELRIARNEIFARHGRIFVSPDLRDYFSRFSWYAPRFDEVDVSSVETANVSLIAQVEKEGSFASDQTGSIGGPSAPPMIFPDSDRRRCQKSKDGALVSKRPHDQGD